MTEIKYKSTTIPVEAGQTVTLHTADKKLTGDISIAFDTAGSFSYKGNTVEVEAGKTAVLSVAGKKLTEDVVVAVEKAEGVANYVTFSSPNTFTLKTYNNEKNWQGTIEYSTDTVHWNTWERYDVLSSSGDGKLYLRGTGNSRISANTNGSGSNYCWVLNGSQISCIGNIENLLDYTMVANGEHPAMASYCFSYMFYGCSALVRPPELPATTLSKHCYSSMFQNCTSLVSAPVLPATTLIGNCYTAMFAGCTSLAVLPALPAITLASSCYLSMFSGCTSVKLSTTQTDEYQTPYRIPSSGNSTWTSKLYYMFSNTGGTFTGEPTINTTYYTSNEVV